ncbi:MAG: type II secretion system GspH family protein [Planctomycetes bacterium]|nr:type II secretion system GspH family protein [Planctomycetota bacterium]
MTNHPHSTRALRAAPSRRGGFTLVELLVVIGVIAMLVGLLIVGINAAQKRAQRVNTQFLMSSISQALSRFKSDHGYYPPLLGDPSTLTTSTLWGTAALSATPSTQVGYMRDLLPSPSNTASAGQTTKVGQWSSAKAKALQDWNSVTTLPEYLLGAGDRSADGYGICGELSSPPPTDLKAGEREQPRAGIRSPGMDGVWGAALQPITNADVAATPGAAASYSGVTLGAPTRKGLFFTRNLALPSRVLIATTTATGNGNDTTKCILRSRANLEGKVYGPYLELKDPSILGGIKGIKANGDYDIVRATDGDDNFDRYPKVILDYWGQPIRFYRRGYVNYTPNTPDAATDGTRFDLGDFFALRPTSANESEFVPNAQAKDDVLDDENPDLPTSIAINGKDRSSTQRLRSAEFALLSSGPDRKLDRTRRIALTGPAKDVDINADNIVETGP